MINVSDIIQDPDFAQSFTIYRTNGAWKDGIFVTEKPYPINAYGVILPVQPQTLALLPEGERILGSISIRSLTKMYKTNPDGISDEIEWHGERYKITETTPWQDFGFFEAYAVRKEGC